MSSTAAAVSQEHENDRCNNHNLSGINGSYLTELDISKIVAQKYV